MINRREIDDTAETLAINPPDVERDYVYGWILAAISQRPELHARLVLKGGNALRKGYFTNTRYSKDLDFVAPEGISRELLRSELLEVTRFVADHTGVQFLDDRLVVVEPARVNQAVEVIEVRAYFADFYGKRSTASIRVYMQVTEFDRLLLAPCERPLSHPYSDAPSASPAVRCVALEEILASKLKCLLQRRKASDLFDYLRWLTFDDVPADQGQILEVFLQKTIYGRAPGAAFDLLVGLPVAVFETLWERHVVAPSTCKFSLAAALERFTAHLADLFGSRQSWKPMRLSFFPPALREPIMSAGREQHLLKIVYDGVARTVEPYALKYKVTKEHGGREYFFAYDRSGGRSGTQSIKTFLADKVTSIEETDETFKPRFEIEVAQAGDHPEDPYFRGRSRASFVPGFGITRRSRGQGVRGPRYRYRCPVCGKQFARKTLDPNIRGHKHPSGHRCSGTWGIPLGRR